MPRRLTPVRDGEPTTTYAFRDIPTRIWKAAKLRALKEDADMRSVLLRLLERYVKVGLEDEKEKR